MHKDTHTGNLIRYYIMVTPLLLIVKELLLVSDPMTRSHSSVSLTLHVIPIFPPFFCTFYPASFSFWFHFLLIFQTFFGRLCCQPPSFISRRCCPSFSLLVFLPLSLYLPLLRFSSPHGCLNESTPCSLNYLQLLLFYYFHCNLRGKTSINKLGQR